MGPAYLGGWSRVGGQKPAGGRPWVPGVGHTGGGVAEEFQVADFLCDSAQLHAGAEALYLRTEDFAEGHVSEVEGGPVSDSCGDGNAGLWVRKSIGYSVRRTWYKH
jgi:hypothetical protein